jgi:hypothetical protein
VTSYSEGEVSEDKCEVRISGGKIWVSYMGVDGPVVCTENLIRVDVVMESPKLAE